MRKEVICGWCRKNFMMEVERGKHGFPSQRCPHCHRMVQSSRKELREGAHAVKQYIHSEWKKGDVV